MAAQRELLKASETINFGFVVRQIYIENLTPNPVYINFSDQPPTASDRDMVVGAFQSRTSHIVSAAAISYRTQAPTAAQQAAQLTAYEEASGGPTQGWHEVSLGEQVSGYPFVLDPANTPDQWHDMPEVPPSGHQPVTFYIYHDEDLGLFANMLANRPKGANIRELMYVCGRVGVFTRLMPDDRSLQPSLWFSAMDLDGRLVVDCFYTSRQYFSPFDGFGHNLADPQTIAAGVTRVFPFPILPGTFRVQLSASATAGATNFDVTLKRYIYMTDANSRYYFVHLPTTNFPAPLTLGLEVVQVTDQSGFTARAPGIGELTVKNAGAFSASVFVQYLQENIVPGR